MSQKIVHVTDSRPSPQSATLLQATGTALTSTYATIGEEINVDGASAMFLRVIYTAGDETSVEVRARYRVRAAGNLCQPSVVTTSAATTVIALLEYRFSGTGNFSIPFSVEGRFVTFEIKTTGGSALGSYGAEVYVDRD